jgi:hypothetical protein
VLQSSADQTVDVQLGFARESQPHRTGALGGCNRLRLTRQDGAEGTNIYNAPLYSRAATVSTRSDIASHCGSTEGSAAGKQQSHCIIAEPSDHSRWRHWCSRPANSAGWCT